MPKKISGIRIDADNTKLIKEALPEDINKGLEKIGITAERAAKTIAREKGVKDTGLLINSITHALAGEAAAISTYADDNGKKTGSYSGVAPVKSVPTIYIGTNVPYAAINEVGGRGRAARSYLKPAIEDFKDTYKQIFEDELKNG